MERFSGYGRGPVFFALLVLGLHYLIPALISNLWLGIILLTMAALALFAW